MTNVILRGYADLEGETLGVFLAGLDCGDFPVIGSRITIPLNGTVARGLLTERWLNQVTAMGRDWGMNTVILDGGAWNVPCVVGYRYVSRGQLLRPVTPTDTGAEAGPAFGKYRQIKLVVVQVASTAKNLKIGTTFDPARMHPILPTDDGRTPYSETELFTGIHVDTIEDEADNYDNMIAWEATGPQSAQVVAIGGMIQTKDR